MKQVFIGCVYLLIILYAQISYEQSIPTKTPYDKISVVLKDISIDNDVSEGGRRGLRIKVNFEVSGLKDTDLKIVVRIQKENGEYLTSDSPSYVNSKGELEISRSIRPIYPNAVYKELPIFIPYSEINIKGISILKLNIDLNYGNNVLIKHLADKEFNFNSGVGSTNITPNPTPEITLTPIPSPKRTPISTVTPTPQTPTPRPTQSPVIIDNNSNRNLPTTPTPKVEESVTPTPLPPSKIDEIMAKMNLGNIAFVTPENLTLGKSETVYLRLGMAQTIEDLKQEIENEGIKGQINTVKGIKVDSQMQAVLTAAEDDFKVTPITPDTLPISNQTSTEWKWDIVARRGGNLKLHLILNAIVEYEDGAGKRPVTIKTFDKTFIVAVPWSENAILKFFGNNWQWLWTTLVVPISLWFWNRKRKETRRKTGIDEYKERMKEQVEKKSKAGFVKSDSERKNSTKESESAN
jgi:hypothetical protein